MNSNHTLYTLESLEKLKAEKKAELDKTKEKIADMTHAIMSPPETNNNVELWMHYASYGIAAYRGLMTCIKLFKRFKGNFSKKKKSKSIFS